MFARKTRGTGARAALVCHHAVVPAAARKNRSFVKLCENSLWVCTRYASRNFSPGFRMMARSGWFWVRFWTAGYSPVYGWREGTRPEPLRKCQRRNSVA